MEAYLNFTSARNKNNSNSIKESLHCSNKKNHTIFNVSSQERTPQPEKSNVINKTPPQFQFPFSLNFSSIDIISLNKETNDPDIAYGITVRVIPF